MKINIRWAIAVCVLGISLSGTAEVPQSINYQGRLTDLNGAPLVNETNNAADGQIDLVFQIFDAPTGGNSVWTNVQQDVAVNNGLFSVLLNNLNTNVFPAANQISRWLEVQVRTGAITNTLQPRKEIVSVAYAIRAADADMVDGKHANELGGVTNEVDPTVTNWVKDGVSWVELKDQGMPADFADDVDNVGITNWAELTTNGMPADFADGIDDVGITVELDPTVTNWVKDGVTWNELKGQGMPAGFTDDVDNVGITNWVELTTNGMPAGFADGIDDVGITVELDPTVTNWVKDGVSWAEIRDIATNMPDGFKDGIDDVGITNWAHLKAYGMPAGFTDDIDDVGITNEVDPQVGVIANNYVPHWNSATTQLVTGTIFDDGKVGIGTESPQMKLDVNGPINFLANNWIYTAGSRPLIRDSYFGYSGTYRAIQIGNQIGSETGNMQGIALGIDPSVISGGAFNGDEIALPNIVEFMQANPGKTDWIQNVLVLNNGYVGIGRPDPNAGLHINRPGGWGSLVIENYYAGGVTYFDHPERRNYIRGTTIIADQGGNVGLGTASPEYKLDVNGTINLPANTWISGAGRTLLRDSYFGYPSGNYRVTQLGTDLSTRDIAIGVDPTSVAGGAFTGTGEIALPNSVEFMQKNSSGTDWLQNVLVLKNGNVGIGTTTPEHKLDVNGNAIIRGQLYLSSGGHDAIQSAYGPFLAFYSLQSEGYTTVLVPAPKSLL